MSSTAADAADFDHDHLDRDLEARVTTTRALRNLTHAFVTHDAPIEAIEALGRWAAEHSEAWSRGPLRDRMTLFAAARARAEAEGRSNFMSGGAGFEDRAVAGKANPSAVDITLRELGEVCTADVVFRKANEGPPGRAHGGVVASVFDDVTGYVIGHLGEPAFTGEITVRLHAPVPLNTPLEFRTWLEHRDGRKLDIHAEALDGEHVVATCRALYITVDPTRFTQS